MDSDGPDQLRAPQRQRVVHAGDHEALAAADDGLSAVLADPLRRWEDCYFRGQSLDPEALGIDDPGLIGILRSEINARKKFYAFLGMPNDREVQAGAAEPKLVHVDTKEPMTVVISNPKKEQSAAPEAAFPPSIGRYKVSGILGRGAFGTVYLAHDTELDRPVAIKVLNRRAVVHPEAAAYPDEARTVAGLSHPKIVPIYDVGHAEDGRSYIVSKYIDDGDLATKLKKGRPGFSRSARLIAVICDTLHYTHAHDRFHRDIKPANILIDTAGMPYLTDFGLALKDEDFGTGPHHLGTPAYMSPEQARGEGHLVDGRSDIFSLGVVFYVMLTGRRPFRGTGRHQMIQQIINSEPRPPRQIDDKIPKELQRICLKAIAKRASERYATAGDMADDLREFLKTAGSPKASEDLPYVPPGSIATESSDTGPTTISDQSEAGARPIKIVPKGICSFDVHDADFFPSLLPGLRDRDGLPDSLRFWKMKIQATEPDETFRVGLIYGPSGCGKSSLIKAGLIPRLDKSLVTAVYAEATTSDTEAHLVRNIRHHMPDLPGDLGLARLLALLRRKGSQNTTPKVILILDQFEQWLSARGHEQETELVTALRQCDGSHVQAICLLRDDFWMAATRFMRDLEIDLVPTGNVAAVDLFDLKHARKVLAAYGRAYETLPVEERKLTKEQKVFLDQATDGLAQDGRVVPVRLALFVEMIKNKPWTPATLHTIGGMDGVGVKFLEDSFTSPRSNPVHRCHQAAAKAVLESLLPETNADIKGRMRSIAELRDISGYRDRPADFAELMHVLDRNLRLITPVDLQSSIDEGVAGSSTSERYYQLTHDYLVHSLRNWVNKEKRATRRGRAELLLAERSGLWNVKPQNRYLPSVQEWATIGLLAKRTKWTEPQRRMMRCAGQVHGTRLVAMFALLFLLSGGVVAYTVFSETQALLNSLSNADIEKISGVLNQLSGYPRWTYSSRLHDLANGSGNDDRSKLGYSLARLSGDHGQIDYLYERLLRADPAGTTLICDRLQPRRGELTGRLWNVLREAAPDDSRILPVAGALMAFNRRSSNWSGVGDKVARALVKAKLDDVKGWVATFEGLRDELRGPLIAIYEEKWRPEDEHLIATSALCHYAENDTKLLVGLLLDADAKSFATVYPLVEANSSNALADLRRAVSTAPGARSVQSPEGAPGAAHNRPGDAGGDQRALDEQASRAAKAAVALVRLGYASEVWQLLEYHPDPRSRSAFVDAVSTLGVNPLVLASELARLSKSAAATAPDLPEAKNNYLFDKTTSRRRGLILSMAGYPLEAISHTERERLVNRLLDVFRNDPDAGVHSAAELVLARWGFKDRCKIPGGPVRAGELGKHRWHVNSAGQTMVLIDGPVDFEMGSPPEHPDHEQEEFYHRRTIPRRFLVGSREVTNDEFRTFAAKKHRPVPPLTRWSQGPDCPQVGVNWGQSAEYCNWLSEEEGLTSCYKPNEKGEYGAGMRVDGKAVDDGAYRLLTEAEWEYACRAGTSTTHYCGNSPDLLMRREWYVENSGYRAHPCGLLLPNELGLFDMLGNVWEWCHDRHLKDEPRLKNMGDDLSKNEEVLEGARYLRGDCFTDIQSNLRSAHREWMYPWGSNKHLGFRIGRTVR